MTNSNMPDKVKNNYFDGLPIRRNHMILFLIICFAYFCEQLDANNFSFIAPALIKDWKISSTVIGQISSAYFVGMFLGGLVGGIFSDLVGRRKAFLVALLIVPISSLVNAYAQTVPVFLIARSVTGFGVFCMMVVAAGYMAEVTPAESRGKWYTLTAAIGFLAMPAIGLLSRAIIPTAPDAWRTILLIGTIGIIPLFVGFKYLVESPRWLVNKGRVKEAEEVVEKLTGVAVDLSDAVKTVSAKVNVSEVLFGMFSRKYIKRTVLLFVAVACTGIASFAIQVWMPTLLGQKGFSLETSLTIGTVSFFGPPVGLLLASFVADKGGRKIPIAVFAVLAALFAYVFSTLGNNAVMVGGVQFLFSVCVMAYSFMLNPYVGESYETKMRTTASGFINSSGRLLTALSQLFIPLVVASYTWKGLYIICSTIFVFTGLIILIFGMSTGKKSLEDIS